MGSYQKKDKVTQYFKILILLADKHDTEQNVRFTHSVLRSLTAVRVILSKCQLDTVRLISPVSGLRH